MTTVFLTGNVSAKTANELTAAASDEFDQIIVGQGQGFLRATPEALAKRIASISGAYSFFNFGAIGDGSTDDSAAVQAALRSGKSIVNPRHTVFACASTVSAPNVNTYVRGGVLKFTGGTDGVQLHHTGTYAVDWDDCEIRTTQEKSGNGLSITYTAAVLAANRHEELVRLGDGLQIGGTDAETGAWTVGLYGDNLSNADIGAIHVRGRRNLSASSGTHDREYLAGTIGIHLTSTDDGSPVTTDLSRVHVRACETGIKLSGAMEGNAITGGQVINCRYGIDANYLDLVAGTDAIDPGLWVEGVHINASERCIIAKNLYEGWIKNCELYRFTNVDGVGWQAYEFDTLSEMQVGDNVISGFNTTGTPGSVDAGTITNTKRSRFFGDILRNCDSGIDVTDAASVNNDFRDLKAFNSSAKATWQTVTFSGGAGDSNIVSFDGGKGLKNSATGVTVTNSTTNIVAKSIPDGAVGEVYEVSFEFEALKGGTAGLTKLFGVQTGGTGTASFDLGSAIDVWQGANHSANENYRGTGKGYATVTVAGTIQITLQGQSAGSNATVDGAIRIRRIA